MAAGAWFVKYRYLFYAVTFTLLGFSFYRTYWGKAHVSRRNRMVLWAVAALSLTLTTLSIIKNLRAP